MIDGARVDAQILSDGRLRMAVPKGAREVRMVSRHAVAREALECSPDTRRLGVCVSALEASLPSGKRDIALDDAALGAGWHACEQGWRWTDGDARLAVTGPALLHVTLAGRLPFSRRAA